MLSDWSVIASSFFIYKNALNVNGADLLSVEKAELTPVFPPLIFFAQRNIPIRDVRQRLLYVKNSRRSTAFFVTTDSYSPFPNGINCCTNWH